MKYLFYAELTPLKSLGILTGTRGPPGYLGDINGCNREKNKTIVKYGFDFLLMPYTFQSWTNNSLKDSSTLISKNSDKSQNQWQVLLIPKYCISIET